MSKGKPSVSADAFALIKSLNDLRKEANKKSCESEIEVERLKIELILARNKVKAMFKVLVLSCGVGAFSIVIAMLSLAGVL